VKRRAILLASAAWLVAPAGPALSQAKPPRRIAVVLPGSRAGYQSRFNAFRGELKKLGYVEGRDLLIDIRWGEDRMESLEALAAEAVSLHPELIVTASSAGVTAVRKATSSIPIVFASAGNPVERGFVASLNRPGGNITGVLTYADITPKIVELAREALPEARRLALLIYDTDPAHKYALDTFEPSAKRFNFEPIIVCFSRPEELDRAFEELAERKADAVILPDLTFFASRPSQVTSRALKARLPVLGTSILVAESGGLLSYGTSGIENYRRAAAIVDKILRGAKPADLPVEQPQRFLLVVNRKTANAIGVTLSAATMLRAEKIID
jgi:putative tryptophan/tyrosine transport system substrate-binding protein